MIPDNSALTSALSLRAQGFIPIPIREGKNPYYADWGAPLQMPIEECTEDFIANLFHKHPAANGYLQNVGVLCGGSLVVFDADSEESIKWCKENLPQTSGQVSRGTSDRRHFYFKAPERHDFKTMHANGEFDFLSKGAQAIAPGSIHPDSKEPYCWIPLGANPCLIELPELCQQDYEKIVTFFNESKNKQAKDNAGGRNNEIHKLAIRLANQGTPDNQIESICITHYRTEFDNSIDPDSDEQIRSTVRSACNFVRNTPPYVANAANVAGGRYSNIKDPEPLRPPEIKRQRYPVEELGEMLSSLVNVIERDVKAPIEAVANTVLATAATAAQTHACIAAPHGDEHPLSLLLVTVVNSGERKSVIHKICEQGLIDAEKEMMREYVQLVKKFKIASKVYSAEEKKILADKSLSQTQKNEEIFKLDKPTPPLLPNIVIDNTTAEGLHKTLEGGYPSVGLLSDEGGIMLGGHAHTSENELRIMTITAKLWDGATIDRHRAGDGSSKIRNRAFSLHLMAQSEVAKILLENKMARSQGLLNRMLIAKPTSLVGTREYQETNVFNEPEVVGYRKKLYDLASTPIEYDKHRPGELNRVLINLSEGAIDKYKLFHDYIEKNCRAEGEYSAVSGFAIRSPEIALRLAGVMAMIEQAPAIPMTLDEEYFVRGANLAVWYVHEQLRITDEASAHSDATLGETLLEFVKSLQPQPSGEIHLIKRNATQRGPRTVRRDDDFNRAVRFLIDRGILVSDKPGIDLVDMDGKVRARRKSWCLVRIHE